MGVIPVNLFRHYSFAVSSNYSNFDYSYTHFYMMKNNANLALCPAVSSLKQVISKVVVSWQPILEPYHWPMYLANGTESGLLLLLSKVP